MSLQSRPRTQPPSQPWARGGRQRGLLGPLDIGADWSQPAGHRGSGWAGGLRAGVVAAMGSMCLLVPPALRGLVHPPKKRKKLASKKAKVKVSFLGPW